MSVILSDYVSCRSLKRLTQKLGMRSTALPSTWPRWKKLYNRSIEEARRALWNDVGNEVNDENNMGSGNGDGSDNDNGNGKSNNSNEIRINISLLLKSASPQAVLFELLSPLGFSPSTIRDILESLTGEPGCSSTGDLTG